MYICMVMVWYGVWWYRHTNTTVPTTIALQPPEASLPIDRGLAVRHHSYTS